MELAGTAVTWTAVIGGKVFAGAGVYQGTTGYLAEVGGRTAASRLAALERLAISA